MTTEQIELHRAADEAWDRTYDEALAESKRKGRRYDRFEYAEHAAVAKYAALKDCACCGCQKRRARAAELLAEVA